MNVDLLINRYYLIVKELEKDEKRERKEKQRKIKDLNLPSDKIENRWRRLLLLGLGTAFFVYIFGLFLFNNLWMILIGFISMVFFAVFASFMTTREQSINKWISYSEKHDGKRLRALRELLIQYGLTIDQSTIDSLIAEATKNKSKYGSIILSNLSVEKKELADLSAKFVALTGAIVGLLVKIINLINEGLSEAEKMSNEIGLAITDIICFFSSEIPPEELNALIQLLLWIVLLLFSLLLLCFCYRKDIDPIIRKRYYFHDLFIEDLKNLLLFNEYYKSKIIVINSD